MTTADRRIKEGMAQRIVALESENARLLATVERVEALPARWIAATNEGRGFIADHWRGGVYVDGTAYMAETCADDLRAALAPEGGEPR